MGAFGCVEIIGPKWCGKTWAALSRSASMSKLDDPAECDAAEVDPKLALMGSTPHLVDEWQGVPEVWDAARRYVDDSGNKRGQLLLTGSTSLKKDARERVHHSGTGRIARLHMRPMTLVETGDPSIAAALLGATPPKLLKDTQTLGLLFESLVIRDLRVFLSTYAGLGNELWYYRDDRGLEVDAIVECGDRWAGIEVKLSDTKADEGASNLLKLRDRVTSNPDAKNAEPAFLAVIVGRGSLAYMRDDGVLVIPASLLGA